MSLIKKGVLKKYIKGLDTSNVISSISKDVYESMDKAIDNMLVDAIRRAWMNNRRTLFGRDI